MMIFSCVLADVTEIGAFTVKQHTSIYPLNLYYFFNFVLFRFQKLMNAKAIRVRTTPLAQTS